jgi:hypothetical protein
MHKIVIGIIIGSLIGFIIGLISSPEIDRLLTLGTMRVQGNLEYASAGDPSASGSDPEGSYIVQKTRFYISPVGGNTPMKNRTDLVGKFISAQGILKIVCGQDTFPCYPLIKSESIEVIKK